MLSKKIIGLSLAALMAGAMASTAYAANGLEGSAVYNMGPAFGEHHVHFFLTPSASRLEYIKPRLSLGGYVDADIFTQGGTSYTINKQTNQTYVYPSDDSSSSLQSVLYKSSSEQCPAGFRCAQIGHKMIAGRDATGFEITPVNSSSSSAPPEQIWYDSGTHLALLAQYEQQGKLHTLWRVTKVKEASIPASEFAAPNAKENPAMRNIKALAENYHSHKEHQGHS
jgi:outer membrane lipoprotein-sorting protein